MATVNFELRNRPDKKGLCLLRVVIQDKGKRVFLPLGVKLNKSDWDHDGQKVKPHHPRAGVINNVLKLKMADLQAAMATESLNGDLSLEKIAGRKVSKTSLLSFAGSCFARWEKTKSWNSIRAYQSMLKQAISFDRVNIEDITPDWLMKYEDHCRSECGDGGTLKRIAFISVILKEAIRQGIIDRDPFLIYRKPPKKNPPKVWLTMDELARIEQTAKQNGSEVVRKTAWWFLLACYTGLRYSDIEKFDSKKNIHDGRLILYTQKTSEVVSIKLTRKIKELIRIVDKQGTVYSNQKMNNYLKAVARHSKIDKLLTFHTARHSFAVNCANLGISQEVAAKLLGHSDLRTTALYYKIVNSRVDKEMEKWEN